MAGRSDRLKLPFRYLEPTFFAGLFDDPVLYVKIRPTGRGLLFDCGKLHHLAKRVLKSLDAVFVSHAHMDHFMGFEALTRSMHVTPRTLDLFGPPGITGKVAHKLQGYDWNLTEEWWGSWRVHEIAEHGVRRTLFPGPDRFVEVPEGGTPRGGEPIWRNRLLTVRCAGFDHKIPVLGFRIEERPGFCLDPRRISALGMKPGRWVEELNRRWAAEELESFVSVDLVSGGCRTVVAGELYADLCCEKPAPAIGYLTDIGFNRENIDRAVDLLAGVDLLICECSFLAADEGPARRSYHLCTSDLNRVLGLLKPAWVLPMHLSKVNLGRSEQLYAELDLPPGTGLLRLPDYVSTRPLIPEDLPFNP